MKTLYFEGAGIVPCGEVENCRIRTAFRNKRGEPIYLELTGNDKAYRFDETKRNPVELKGAFGWVDHCYNIDFYEKHRSECDGRWRIVSEKFAPDVNFNLLYTKADILRFVNDKLDGGFDEIVILPYLAGYRVHKGNSGYNFGDEFQHDERRTEQAEKIKQWFYDREKERGAKYPCFSIWFDGDLLRVRFFDGRGQIEIPDVYAFEFK